MFTYSCNEFINTLDVYSNSNDVFDKPNASLFGLLKAKAVPSEDLLLAPMSVKKKDKYKQLIYNLLMEWCYLDSDPKKTIYFNFLRFGMQKSYHTIYFEFVAAAS